MADNPYAEYFSDKGGLGRISRLAAQMLETEAELADAEAKVKQLSGHLSNLVRKEIPDALDEVGLESITLKGGLVLKIEEKLSVKPTEANKPAVYDWLEKNGYGGLIKRVVSVALSRDQEVEAKKLRKGLEQLGLPATEDRWVEPQTLKKFASDAREEQREFPEDLFGVFVAKEATLKAPKAKAKDI